MTVEEDTETPLHIKQDILRRIIFKFPTKEVEILDEKSKINLSDYIVQIF